MTSNGGLPDATLGIFVRVVEGVKGPTIIVVFALFVAAVELADQSLVANRINPIAPTRIINDTVPSNIELVTFLVKWIHHLKQVDYSLLTSREAIIVHNGATPS